MMHGTPFEDPDPVTVLPKKEDMMYSLLRDSRWGQDRQRCEEKICTRNGQELQLLHDDDGTRFRRFTYSFS